MKSFLDVGAKFFWDILARIKSVWVSSMTAVPYLFSTGEFRKEVTEYYPDPVSAKTAEDLPARSRGFLFNDINRCTGCKECEKVCPVSCIQVEVEPGMDPNQAWVSVFNLDHAKCLFCGLCVDVCPPRSLVHTKKYEGAVLQRDSLIASYGKGTITHEHKTKWKRMRERIYGDSHE